MNRLLGRVMKSVSKPWQMYPLGILFGLDLNILGYAVVALFVATWVVALLVWRLGRIEEKWTTSLLPADHTH
ncbi:hypothetical protein GCM10010313_02950 [Streptomyces violarus]|uniref:High-affinity nickel permease n=1 Tax=Streptomyces violarus TaxID=67380 RepID=A0A7W4ZJV0_9ACTN|nr:high-affinity nickel permease [Streptomyces violarus]GHC96540.1 hypothetical protein GCM10010313_02950 [Streptomyces violarus]